MNGNRSSVADGDGVVIGIDLGGTGTRIVAVTRDHTVIATRSMTTPHEIPEGGASFLARQVREIVGIRALIAVGIGASGPIDGNGVIRNFDTLPAFTDDLVVTRLESELQRPVVIDNDAVAAAVAEYTVGAGQGARCLLHLTLGTGVGGAVLRDGEPVRGGDGQHPEAGHISTAGDAAPCYCGRDACWEQKASRRALQRLAAQTLGSPENDPAVVGELAARAQDGDPAAVMAFGAYGTAVADGLATLLAVHRPDAVVIGGSPSAYFELFQPALARSLGGLGGWVSRPIIRATALDDFGGAIGGAMLALM